MNDLNHSFFPDLRLSVHHLQEIDSAANCLPNRVFIIWIEELEQYRTDIAPPFMSLLNFLF